MKRPFLTALALLPLAAAAQPSTVYTPELLWKLGRLGEMQVSPDRKTVAYTVTRYNLSENKSQADIWVVPVAGGPARQLTNTPGSESTLNWRPDGKLTFLSGEGGTEQLYVMNADGSGKQKLSEFPDEGLANLKYAPTGKFILYTQDVKTGKAVQDWYPDLPKADARIIDDLNYRHWNVWDDYKSSHVFFQPLGDDGRPTGYGKDVMPGERFDAPLAPLGGSEQLAFSPDGYRLAYTSRKLYGKAEAESTNSDIYLYDIREGNTQNLSEGLGGYDVEPVFSPDGTKVAWLSMATPGFESDRNGIVVYDFKTRKREDITKGSEQSAANIRWSPDGKTLYFLSVLEGTEQLFSIPSKGGKLKQLTKGAQNYNSFELAGPDVAIANKTTQAQPADLVRLDLKTGRETPLTRINEQELAGVKTGKTEARWVRTTDGKQMQVYVIYPPDFDPSKKYPTLLYCQGGPQSPITQSFSYRWNFQLLAAGGYIVVAPNRRGLPGFGTEWNNSISGDWGGQPIRDYLSAIDAISQEPYVDKDRRGCVGASYGGYSVYQLAGKHEGRFKTFIAHAGLYNLTSWYPSTEEVFFAKHDMGGAPWDATLHKSYTDFNPQLFAKNWDTPLLVIHGGKDFRVPEDQGMQAFGTAQLRGIPSRFLYFPNEGHWISKPQNSVLWNRVFFEWLARTLKPEGQAAK
ncbi:dipeptidyl aminopeptidase/acylaminoacyl peptidase [Hymenobacter luteus]|uniref:Dipeptidyl aminopeptidase/acylaminoacyl peptidase n=2 Tax=Hymenobacter TaxID=89966 RepID=A0A7W9SXA3_9BACT|nr:MULTISPECIES: S9 family peptidase [Hymenobacter]MBB4600078.1 dipeptidyl aminopeptidase/acylaminoacyl peptidase [Hymenobacter latericoloratus]MBB6057612.1 dipeptidyl aminopeptidase/acylaminoacyl peptidase [Hymenobacter luteus]